MSVLTDLRAALDAALASEHTKGKVWDDFRDLLDTDTIRALLDVAEAGQVLDDALAGVERRSIQTWIEDVAKKRDAHRAALAPLVKEADDD